MYTSTPYIKFESGLVQQDPEMLPHFSESSVDWLEFLITLKKQQHKKFKNEKTLFQKCLLPQIVVTRPKMSELIPLVYQKQIIYFFNKICTTEKSRKFL